MTQRQKTKKSTEEEFITQALAHGALAAKEIDPRTVETAEWVLWKCRFGCDGYNTSLVCPPHSPKPSETRFFLDHYTRGILFEAPEGKAKKIAVSLERELFLAGHYKSFGMGAGPCLPAEIHQCLELL
ncbi:MAG: DUF2284 domain-containing protein [Vulcanimicrobiota bacterium]